MTGDQDCFARLCDYARETSLLASVEALLGWDERTYLPADGGEHRADQLAYLAGQIHARRTSPQLGDLLEELCASPLAADRHDETGATIFHLRREYDKQRKLPGELVRELTRAAVIGQRAWSEARKSDDFASLAPHLQRMYELKRRQAEAIGYEDCLYDALLDDYEPEGKSAQIERVLTSLREDLRPLVSAIADCQKRPRSEILKRRYPTDSQRSFGVQAAKQIGFDFRRGRLDVTDHPFCETMGPNDCRITTRFLEEFFPSAFFGVLHEAGHGLYEQGLRRDQYGLPPGQAVSLGIHESQSRLWENFVGRSLAFWRHFFPAAQQAFPAALGDVPLDELYFAINDVRPSLIRVEADEATYNLHIIIRFELEQALLEDRVRVADLPDAWRQKYQEYLGIEPPNDTQGVLQDIHWSAGLVGYFPTYSLGNLYAAQLFAKIEQEFGDLESQFAAGEFRPLLEWLRTRVHRHGRCYPAAELVESVVGQPLSHQPLVEYLRGKLEPLFGL